MSGGFGVGVGGFMLLGAVENVIKLGDGIAAFDTYGHGLLFEKDWTSGEWEK